MAKFDSEKAMFSLIEPKFISELAQVLTMGANKYGPEDWKTTENGHRRYLDALHRHLNAFEQGIMDDEESGQSHLAHVAANAMFLHWLTLQPAEPITATNGQLDHERCKKCTYNKFNAAEYTNMKCITCCTFYGDAIFPDNFTTKGKKPERLVIKSCFTCARHPDSPECAICMDDHHPWLPRVEYSGLRTFNLKTREIAPRSSTDAETVRPKSDAPLGDRSSCECGSACSAANNEKGSRAAEGPKQLVVILDLGRSSDPS